MKNPYSFIRVRAKIFSEDQNTTWTKDLQTHPPSDSPLPFPDSGMLLRGSGLVDKGFSVPRLMDRGSGARLHRTMVPARGWN